MDYILKYTNPKSDAEKKIVGKITVNFDNSEKITEPVQVVNGVTIGGQTKIRYNGSGNGILEGLPTPFTNPTTNQPVPNTGTIGPISTTSFLEITGTESNLTNPDGTLTSIGTDRMYKVFLDSVKRKLYIEYQKVYGLELYQTLSYEDYLTTFEPISQDPQGNSVPNQTDSSLGQTASAPTSSPTNNPESNALTGTASTPTPAPVPTGTKIKLVKKSGPGELMGEVEREAVNGGVSFEGLQFDQPGEYVITAVPDTADFEPIDFKITVKTSEEKPQDPKKEDEPKKDGNRPVIAQIDKTPIKLKPIEIESDKGQQNLEYGKGIGLLPFIWYRAYQIQEREISSLGLYHDGIVPCCTFTFEDSLGMISKDGMPLDNDYFELFFNSGSDFIKSIHMRFKIISFQENKNKTYTITGSIDLQDFYKINFKSYTGTSFDVLREISKELQLGFNSNINSADDSMKWRNPGKRFKEFIGEIINHSYISDNSFVLGYIDFYYCFNYVDIEKEWTRDIKNDVSIESRGLSQFTDAEEEDKIVPLVLTSDKSFGSSNLFFTNPKVTNNSTKNSVNNGQFTVSKFYDSNTKSFLIFDVNSLTSKDDTKVILKGQKSDKTDLETNFRTDFKGRIDTSNVHKNYLYATVQNKTNYQNLTRIQVEFEIPNANFILYKFQKVKLNFVKDSEKLSDDSLSTQRLTGEWLIINIEYMWSRGKMKQKILAVRKELEKLPSEFEEQTTDQKPETKQGEANEVIPADPPNSKFTPNELYTVQAADGRIYTIVVKQLLENGTEISGYVQEK